MLKQRVKWSWLFSTQAQWLGLLIGGLIVCFGTLMPAAQMVTVPGTDKLHHIIGFGGWASLCALGPTRRFVMFSLFIIFMGGAIEIIQPYVNRYGDWYDFWADTLGVFLAYVVHWLACLIKKRGTVSA